jgi:hypothetical protein
MSSSTFVPFAESFDNLDVALLPRVRFPRQDLFEDLSQLPSRLIASDQNGFQGFAHIRWQGVLNWLQVACACLEGFEKDWKAASHGLKRLGKLQVFLRTVVDLDRGIEDGDDGGYGTNHFQTRHCSACVNDLNKHTFWTVEVLG